MHDGKRDVVALGIGESLLESWIIHVLGRTGGNEQNLGLLLGACGLVGCVCHRCGHGAAGLRNAAGSKLLQGKGHWASLPIADVLAVAHRRGLRQWGRVVPQAYQTRLFAQCVGGVAQGLRYLVEIRCQALGGIEENQGIFGERGRLIFLWLLLLGRRSAF